MTEPANRKGPSPFIQNSTLQYAWDSTSLTALMTCAKKYEYEIILGYRPRGDSVHLFFGGLFAKALEHYHLYKASGRAHDDALSSVVDEVLQKTWINGGPWDSGHSKKTRETLVRSVIWYLDTYKEDAAETVILENGKPAVELSFQLGTGIQINWFVEHDAPHEYILSGHIDRLVSFNGDIFVQDQKTTGTTLSPFFFSEFNPHTQMSLYTLASKVVFNAPVQGVMIDAAQIAVGFTAFSRSMTMRSEDQLNEWLINILAWLRQAEFYAREHYYPRNESSCHKFGGCPFRNICSKSPNVRQAFLDTDFETTNPWNPLETR